MEPGVTNDTADLGGPARFAWRVTASHMATYMIAGLLASTLLDYESRWKSEWMVHYRPFDSPWIAAGMGLQVTRGLLFALVLWPFRRVFLEEPLGWLKLWALLFGVGVLSTYAAAPGSIEGVIYTRLPLSQHVFGFPELGGQTLAFSGALVAWYRHPSRAWGIVVGGLAVLGGLMSVAGILFAPA